MNDVMMNFLTKVFNKTEDELGELIFEGEGDDRKIRDGAADALIDLDAKRIGRLKDEYSGDQTKKFDEGYKKAQKEVLSKFENQFKEQTGFDSDLTGVDLIMEWSKGLGKESKVTAENIKTHPEFLKIESEWNKSHQEEIQKVKGEFDEFKSNVERNQVMGKIKDMAETEFMKLNPVLSQDPAKRKAQTGMFLERFDKYNYEFTDDGVVIMNDGKRLEDSHGNRVSFGNFVKSEADKLFDYEVQGKKDAPGNKPADGSISKTVLSRDEYNQKVNEANGDPAKLNEIGKKYTRAD